MPPPPDFLPQSLTLCRHTLLQNILPFWMTHGPDHAHGGISNVLDDLGRPINHDKYLWSQGRALFIFSALHRRIEPRPEWLNFAHHIFHYISHHGRDSAGRWMYRLDPHGKTLDADTSIYVDGFIINGLTEYYAVTRSAPALTLALDTYDNVRARLASPGSYGVAPYEIPPGMKTHGIPMLFSFFFHQLGQVANRPDILAHAAKLSDEILTHFYIPQKNAILEFVTQDGHFSDTPQGRACVMGHALEDLWFQIALDEQARRTDRIPTYCRLIRRHLELAWDDDYAGLKLARDIDHQSPSYWQHPDFKLWWVQVEALVATLFAYRHTGEPWCLDWHQEIQHYAFAHYPVPTGEWTQWLTREGHPARSTLLPVKDPFHLPRALIYMIQLLEHPTPPLPIL